MLNAKEMIDALVSLGALEIDAMDIASGQVVYKVTEKLQKAFPTLYDEIYEQIYRDAMSLWEKGLVEMNVMSDSPSISPAEIGLDRNNWNNLSDGEYTMMNTIMRSFEGGI